MNIFKGLVIILLLVTTSLSTAYFIYTLTQIRPNEESYRVSTYVGYYGSWTILNISDQNTDTHFYLAYQRGTYATETSNSYSQLLTKLKDSS